MLLSRLYETREHQLELPFEGELEWCPRCNPACLLDGGKPECLRSMCARHWREMESAFDSDGFSKSLEEALAEGRKAAASARRHAPAMPRDLPRFR